MSLGDGFRDSKSGEVACASPDRARTVGYAPSLFPGRVLSIAKALRTFQAVANEP